MKKVNLMLALFTLLLLGSAVATNHFGIAIRISNYYFALLAIISLYNIITNV